MRYHPSMNSTLALARPLSLPVVRHWPLAVILAVFTVAALPLVGEPYGAVDTLDTFRFSFIAAYHENTLLQVAPQGWAALNQPRFYTYTLGLLFQVFGVSDTVVRLFNLSLILASLTALYALAQRSGSRTAFLTVALAATTPITYRVFVQGGYYENLTVLPTLLALYAALYAPRRYALPLTTAAFVVALGGHISSLLLVPVLTLALWRRFGRQDGLLTLGTLAIVATALYGALEAFGRATGASTPSSYLDGGNSGAFLDLVYWENLARMLGAPTLALVAAGWVGAVLSWRRSPALALWLAMAWVGLAIGGRAGHAQVVFIALVPSLYFAADALGRLRRVHMAAPLAVLGLVVALQAPAYAERIADTSATSPAIKDAMASIAPEIQDGDGILYGWGAFDTFPYGWYLAVNGNMATRPYLHIEGMDADALTVDGLRERGVRYIVLTDAWRKADVAQFTHVTQTFPLMGTHESDGVSVSIYDATTSLAVSPWETVWEASPDGWTERIEGTVTQDGEAIRLSAIEPVKPNDYYNAVYTLPEPVDWSGAAILSFDLRTTLKAGDAGSYVFLRTPDGTKLAGVRLPEGGEWARVGVNMEDFKLTGTVDMLSVSIVTKETTPPFDAWIRDVRVEALASP